MRNCRSILLLLVGCLLVLEGWGQLSITQANTVYAINFDDTVAGVNVGQFAGSGFTPTPVGGQLNSNAWRVVGLSDSTGSWGGTHNTGDFARGASGGVVVTGGVYAFTVGAGNRALGVQPSDDDFTSGNFALRVANNTGCVLTRIAVNYKVYVLNNENRSNSFNFSYSQDDAVYSNVTALDFISTDTADPSPSWVSYYRSTPVTGLAVPDQGSFYLRWSGADAGVSTGSRDEFALDDIEINVFSDRDVTNLGTNLSCNDRAFVSWDNPVSGTCWNEVLIIASTLGAITAVPTGNGLAYSANDTFGSGTEIAPGEFVVFKGIEEDFVLYGLATDSTYHLKAFTRNDTNWVSSNSHQFDVGEYCFQSVQTGIWSSNSSWEQYDGSQWVLNAGYPNATWQNTLVRSNHWIEIITSPMSCGNLSIEANGRVYNSSVSNRFINIGGDLVCDGVFGSDSGSFDRLGINFNYANHSINGSGTIDCNRIRKDSFNSIVTNLTISSNVTLRWNGLPLYSDCPNCEFNVTVQPGITVSLPGNTEGPGELTLSRIDVSGFGTLNVFGTVEAAVFRPYNRIQSTQSKYVVHGGGTLLVNDEVALSDITSNTPRRDSVIVLSDGEIEFVKAGLVFSNPFNDVDPLSEWVLNAASTATYSSASSQIVESDLQYGHLNLEGSGTKNLNGNTLVRGNLSIGDGSELDVSTSNYDITLWGDWYNQNISVPGFNPRAGKVILKGSAPQSIYGLLQSFYDLELDNSNGAVLLSRAEVTNSLTLSDGKLDIGLNDLDVTQATIGGNFGPTTFIKADDLGYVVANVTTGNMLLPIGRNPYLPLSLSCAGGNSIEVYIRLKQGHDEDPDTMSPVPFTSQVVDAQWEIFAIDTVPNLTIEVGWPVSEQLPGFSPSETFIRHWESGSSTYWTNQLPAAPATGLGPFSRSWSIMSLPGGTHFFGVGGNTLLLSNTSISLSASPGLAGILLTWQAGELPESGSHWIVERHTGAGNWEVLTELATVGSRQEWLDANPDFGQNYYRIAILGPDGSRAWSNIAMARWERQGIWHIGPNPASTHINITASHLGEGVLQLDLYHTSGTRVLAIQAGSGPDMQEQLPLSNLAPGVYMLVVSRGNEPILRERIVIQR